LIEYLASTQGAGYLTLIDISIDLRCPPTSVILHKQPTAKWSDLDWALLEAHRGLQNERCGQCGLPRWICHSEDGDLGFKGVDDTCFASKEIDTVHDKKSSGKNYKEPKGVRTHAEAFRYSGKPVGGLGEREAYYKAKWEQDNPVLEPDAS